MITLEKFKILAKVTDTENDALITELITLVYEEYDNISNKPAFEPYPPGTDLVIVDMIKYRLTQIDRRGIASETIGDYSVSYTTEADFYPIPILKRIKRWGNVKI